MPESVFYFVQSILLFLAASTASAAELPKAPDANDFVPVNPAHVSIGRLLFYDKILSGNRNISCGTCHHPAFGTSDGLSLGIGEGGQGLGTARHGGSSSAKILKRVPRNSQALWNLGARDIHTLFHDGRVSISERYGNGFNTPAEEWLPDGLNSLLAVQALFPLTAQFEMAGNLRENEVIAAVHDRIDAGWPILARRVSAIDEYAELFIDAFDNVKTRGDITITQIANALGAFINQEWRSINSPFDRLLRGDNSALSDLQHQGMQLFFGKAGCSSCHSGTWLSDQKFHALGLPSFGPGRTRRHNLMARDLGRMAESDAQSDAYAFRTPPLRNVEVTAPYGHNGAYPTLAGIIRHHLDPVSMLAVWQPETAQLPDIPWLAAVDFLVQADQRELARQAQAVTIRPTTLTDADITALVSFMHALTDPAARTGSRVPQQVPSGLEVDHVQPE